MDIGLAPCLTVPGRPFLMRVFNLQCALGHGFEGWFGSEADYESQRERGLVSCPLCGAGEVRRLPSAPHLNLSGARAAPGQAAGAPPANTAVAGKPAAVTPGLPPEVVEATRRVAQALQELVQNTDDVGEGFTEEARRIHYGEAPARSIRGQASPEQREALRDEGIDVLALPDGLLPKGPLQ